MPKITKKGIYNLTDRFASTKVEASYTQNDFKNLIMWVQPDSTTALKDGSSFNHTIVETSLVSVGKNRISAQGYEQAFSSVNFNGSASQFRVADADVFSFTDGANNDKPFSASIWVRFKDFSQIHGLFGKAATTSTREYFTTVSTAGAVTFQLFDESANHAITKTSIDGVVVANTWHHVVVTYDGSEGHAGINIYVDGVLTTSQTTATGASYAGSENLGSSFFVGLGMGPTTASTLRYLKGDVGGFALWSKKLTSTSVTALYHRKGYNAHRSGYLSNPVRTLIKDNDNRSGEYPTIHRMNRQGTEGVKPNTIFDDTHTVKYGTRTTDDFEFKNTVSSVFTLAVDDKKWVTSSTSVKMKRELFASEDSHIVSRGVLVLDGTPDSAGRWIRTKNKVSKPTLIFSLIQGPYNTGADNSALATLKLYQGRASDALSVQVSKDALNWQTISMIPEFISSEASTSLIDSSGRFVHQPLNIVTNDIVDGNEVSGFGASNQTQRRPIMKVKVDLHVFNSAGFKEPFYIRLIQTSVSNTKLPNWAIAHIDIISRDQKVTYPYLDIADTATLFHRNKSIATPNQVSAIISTGSSIANISDNGKPFFDEQKIKPFNENVTIPGDNNSFYLFGTSPQNYPGFSRRLTSKTIINYEMNPASDDVISTGLIRNGTAAAAGNSNDDGQVLLTYWNFNLNRWQEIGQPLRDNRGNHANQNAAHAHLHDNITGSCAGFGPIIDSMVNGAVGEFSLKSSKAFEHAFLPISTYGFPNAAKYHATSSQHITAEELGITKPFLLEKLILDFDISFAVPGTRTAASATPPGSAADADAFATIALDTTAGGVSYDNRRLKVITPTFFLLRQNTKKNTVDEYKYTHKTPGTLAAAGFDNTYFEPIPKLVKLDSGSNVETNIFDSRELVTYGQYSLIVTASTSTLPDRLDASGITIQDVLDSGILRDGHTVSVIADAEADNIIDVTGAMNFSSRMAAGHNKVLSAIVHNEKPSGNLNKISFVRLDNDNQTRERSFDGASRALFSGVAGLKFADSGETLIVSQSASVSTVRTFEQLTFDAPYLIFPEDKLIFGWQYPMPRDLRFPKGVSGNFPNSMKVKACSLKMFGSQVKNNKEFHEGLNQNLTTNAVHETIGNEPVIDQWQIATRTEMTGSLSDQFMFAIQTAPAGTEDFVTGYAIGKIISPPPDVNTTNAVQLLWNIGNNPVRRVNSRFSTTLGNSFSLLGDKAAAIKAIDNIDGPKQPANSWYHQIQAFTSLADVKRVYTDSTILNGSSTTSPYGSYGSSQNYSYQSGGSSIIKLGGSPKYYYSTKHYGFIADSIRQGFDGKFLSSELTRGDSFSNASNSNQSPIRVQFVEELIVSDDSSLKNQSNSISYVAVSSNAVDQTSEQSFQSSNISLFATSSLPYFDNNTVSNRTYTVDTVEVVS